MTASTVALPARPPALALVLVLELVLVLMLVQDGLVLVLQT